jgi:hypothetical protein
VWHFRGGIPVIEYLDEGNYTGIDVREIAIDEARKELASYPQFAAKSPRLLSFHRIRHVA